MKNSRKTILLSGAVLLLLGTAFLAGAKPAIKEVPGLQVRFDLPVRSVILRHDLPDHAPRMQARAGKPVSCDKDVDLTTTASGVVAIAAQDNIICTNADLDTYRTAGSTYVVQAGGDDAAWTHTDVSDPANPVIRGQFKWTGGAGKNTYTPDLKAFRQGANNYIVMGLERRSPNAFCGVVIYDVTNPGTPVFKSQYIGSTSNQNLGPAWCDTHNVFVENDGNGNGQYIYATADSPNDMRVLDIGGAQGGSVSTPVEVGRYISSTANNDNYVHDITVIDHGGSVGRRVYLAYWDTGVVILNAVDVTPGINPTPIVGPNMLDPSGFLTHHAFASLDGTLIFAQDEFLNSNGDEPIQMWSLGDPLNPVPVYVDGLKLGSDVPVNPAHNLEIRFDINPNRLYTGWYKLGLQAWDFTSLGFDHNANPSSRTAVQYHQAQTESSDGVYSGAWGVRLENIGDNLYIFQSDRNFGLIVNCVGCVSVPIPTPTSTPTPTPEPGGTGTIKGTITDADTEAKLAGVLVETETNQSATTNRGGKYTIKNVPEGNRTVTASKIDYVTQPQSATVVAGQTTTVNFSLLPSQ